jgi:hypothetical protein
VAQLPGYKEQIHEELFDTLIRGVGASTLNNKTKLFGAGNIGNPALTNMQQGGQLSSEEVFLALSIRFYVQFATAALYRFIEDGLFFTFLVGNKPMLGALPILVAPGGGGMFGHDVNTQAHVITNGLPSWEAILQLAKPVKIDRHQHFAVDVEFYDFPSLDGVTAAISPRTQVNDDLGLKIIKCFLGGILGRQVQ